MDDLKIPNEFLTPPSIVSFIKELSLGLPANKILDPACGSASLLIAVANNRADVELTGIEINESINSIAEKTLEESGFKHKLINANFFSYQLDDKFDLVVCNPPFGMRIEKEIDGLKIKRAEQAFITLSLQALNPNGYAIFIVPEGLLFDSQTAFKKYISQKYSLQAVISLPAGSFPHTGIKTSIVILKNSSQSEKVFFAEFAEQQALSTIASNFHKQTSNNNLLQGFWVNFENIEKRDFVWTYELYKSEKDFEKWKESSKYPLLQLSELIPVEKSNSETMDFVLIQKSSNQPKVILKDELSSSITSKKYIEIPILSNKILPQYLKLYLNSEQGKKQLHARLSGSVVPSLRAKDLESMYVEVPDLKTQSQIILTAQKLSEISTTIQVASQSFYNQLFNYSEQGSLIERFNSIDDKDSTFENLISPLAKSFRIATQGSSNIDIQLTNYFKMFEMIAVLNSIVLLSALPPEKIKIYEKDIWGDKKNFLKASFGSWVGLYRRLAKLYMNLIKDDEKKTENHLFDAMPFDITFYKNLCSQELLTILDMIPEKRNKFAHGGTPSEIDTRKTLDELHPYLMKIFEKLTNSFLSIELLYTQRMEKSNGLYTISVKKLQGTHETYAEQEIQTEVDLNTYSLYLYNSSLPASRNRLELLPEFIKLILCEQCERWSVYFYNKSDNKKTYYVSYQNEAHEQVVEPSGLIKLFGIS